NSAVPNNSSSAWATRCPLEFVSYFAGSTAPWSRWFDCGTAEPGEPVVVGEPVPVGDSRPVVTARRLSVDSGVWTIAASSRLTSGSVKPEDPERPPDVPGAPGTRAAPSAASRD